jgi:hypothetical protein
MTETESEERVWNSREENREERRVAERGGGVERRW